MRTHTIHQQRPMMRMTLEPSHPPEKTTRQIMLEALQAVDDSMKGSDNLLAAQVRDAIRKATQ